MAELSLSEFIEQCKNIQAERSADLKKLYAEENLTDFSTETMAKKETLQKSIIWFRRIFIGSI